MTKEQDRAVQNARAWSETIVALVSAMNADYDRLQELHLYGPQEGDDDGI